jgi:hypothetical protein
MSMKKRFRTLNLALVMVAVLLAVLAGCGEADSEDPIKEPKSWKLVANLPSTGDFSNIAFGKGLFVAATNNKEIISSTDGVTWSSVTNHPDMHTGANFVFFGNNEFILAVRDNDGQNKWARSADGKTWEAVNGLVRSAGGGAYGKGAWVIGSNGGNVFFSKNSTAWTTKATGIADINWINGVAFGKDVFVITGMGGKIAWSGDTDTWNDVSPTGKGANLFGGGVVNSVVFGNGRFMAAGGGASDINNIAVTSTDGKTWTQTGETKETSMDDRIYLGYGDRVFIIGGRNGSAAYTADAHNWTLIADTKLTRVTGIAYGNGKFVMVGLNASGPAIAYSIPE